MSVTTRQRTSALKYDLRMGCGERLGLSCELRRHDQRRIADSKQTGDASQAGKGSGE